MLTIVLKSPCTVKWRSKVLEPILQNQNQNQNETKQQNKQAKTQNDDNNFFQYLFPLNETVNKAIIGSNNDMSLLGAMA